LENNNQTIGLVNHQFLLAGGGLKKNAISAIHSGHLLATNCVEILAINLWINGLSTTTPYLLSYVSL